MPQSLKLQDYEGRIAELRRVLVDDAVNHTAFEKRYRPDIDRMQSATLQTAEDCVCYLRRLTVSGEVYEIIEFLANEVTELALAVDYQTQRISQFSRYIDAEITVVDLINAAQEGKRNGS